MPTEQELEFVKEHHFDLSMGELADELGVSTSTISRWKREHLDLPRATEKNRVEYQRGQDICDVLDHLHNGCQMTTVEMANELGVSRKTLDRWWESCPDIPKRDQSEATRLTYDQMTESERREQTLAANEAARNRYANFRTSHRGYEHWRNWDQQTNSEQFVKVHRLLAVAEFGYEAVSDAIVHHRIPIPWLNHGENLQLIDSHRDHARIHHSE